MSGKSIKEILYDLVSVQSDTGTELECHIAQRIAGYLKSDPYFQAHPDQWGCHTGGDLMGRPVVWALKKGKSNKTVILSGHYDAVEIDCYGELRPYALDPDKLKERIKALPLTSEKLKRHLEDENWMFGRGCGDMKAGVAIALHILLSSQEPEASILFTAVGDEENISSGTRISLPFYLSLKEKFGLDYRLSVISEPQFRNDDDPFFIYNGGTGKILPIIVAKGRLSHCAEPMKGLNAAHIIAEITRNIDLNPELCTQDLGAATQPPIVQIMRDMKTTYDVSLPLFAAACVNILFLGSKNPPLIMEKLKAICKSSMAAVIQRYEAGFSYSLSHGLISTEDHQPYAPVVMDLKELEEIVKSNKADYDRFHKELESLLHAKVQNREMTLQTACLHYMKVMIEAAALDYPLVVAGIAPPYYPSACNEYLDQDLSGILDSIRAVVEGQYQLEARLTPYMSGMGDISYMTCPHPDIERSLLELLALPQALYDIPFEAAAALAAPCLHIGPRSEEIHQWGERVYLPDVEGVVPDTIRSIIANI